MKRMFLLLTLNVAVLGIFCFCVFQFMERINYNSMPSCMANLKQIALGMAMYKEDYDDQLPPAIFPGKTVGWANGLQPYLRSYGVLQCPFENYYQEYSLAAKLQRHLLAQAPPKHKVSQPNEAGFTDYWMNRNLSGIGFETIHHHDQIIMFGDGDGSAPESTASYAINRLPVSWLKLSDSPTKRHLDGANYVFADTHVKWLKPELVSQLPPSKKLPVYTFSIK